MSPSWKPSPTPRRLALLPKADVIVDVGGQDIKLIILKNGHVKDFKLNTQCSAGNGYFLQSTALGFGFKVEDYADIAFSAGNARVRLRVRGLHAVRHRRFPAARLAPRGDHGGFGERVAEEHLALRRQIPNLVKLGTTFVLQGGTQHNLAAVKSQVDFIASRFKGAVQPEIHVHKFCGEAGAIGEAVEAHRLYTDRPAHQVHRPGESPADQYRTTRGEETRCYFCKNKCLRTSRRECRRPA